jgi:DNA (cytosine-5)-methyltransferase 1
MLTSLELCAGAGGQALGLELAGFDHVGLVEIDKHACATLRANRPNWNVIEQDLRVWEQSLSEADYPNTDLVAGGVPCPPFSVAGRQLGPQDERDLFPVALKIVAKVRPRAVMLENVRGLLDPRFNAYRAHILAELDAMGYGGSWRLFNASDFGVAQLRPRSILVAISKELVGAFEWPSVPLRKEEVSVGEALADLMAAGGWEGAEKWSAQALGVAPTLVGGSKKHGGPDLGPTRAKNAWAKFGVNGAGLANDPPVPGFVGLPKLTVRMAARLQGFPDDWQFAGGKTAAYRQVGNAFPPPVAAAVARQIALAVAKSRRSTKAA